MGSTNGFLLAGSPDNLKMDKPEGPITEGEMMKDFDYRTKCYANIQKVHRRAAERPHRTDR